MVLFSTINWNLQNQWLNISADIRGGITYVNLGTSKLNQVTYAMHATSASTIIGGTQTLADVDNNNTKTQCSKIK